MGKNVLISWRLLRDCFLLIHCLEDEPIPDDARRLCAAIEFEIVEKLRRMEVHKAFSAYKSAPSGQERESLRLEYIRLAEFHRDFISSSEVPYPIL